jgi:ATP-binding cassette subfamily B protein
MEEILTAFRKEQISVDNKKFWSTVVAGIIGTVGYGFAFYIIVAGVSRGDISLGTMVFLVSLLGQLVGSISSLFSHIAKQFEDNLYVTDIFTFLDTKPYIKRANNPQKLNLKTPPKIEFKNVWFRYTEDMEWILKDVSMTLNPYEKLALIGENGAGKSTLIKLLARIYDPDKGDILVNDINLKEIDPDEWTSYLGILLQDFMNYNFSVGESIAMGRMEQHPPLEEVKRAATLSGADDFISDWEYKYAEQIGKEFSGKEPSKGQNQKLALARIIYRRGLVTVLDEPTASIDPMAEMNIFENMEEASKDSTLILITHRFNTVKNVDQIIVLEHGKIIETGNHKELLEKKGRYAEMYSAQAKSFMEDAE